MAAFADLSLEERLGVGVAIVLHVALAAGLMLQDPTIAPYTPPERIDISLASDVSLESTAPDPSAEPAAAYAPNLFFVPLCCSNLREASYAASKPWSACSRTPSRR